MSSRCRVVPLRGIFTTLGRAPLQGLDDGISQRLLERLRVLPFRCIRYLVTISVVTRANMQSPKATIYDDLSN